MRVLVCGSRGFGDAELVRRVFCDLAESVRGHQPDPEPITIIEGGARGADAIARRVAEEFGFGVEEYPSDWKRYGKGAGIIRNQQMLDEGLPDAVIAFSTAISPTPGTADMVRRARDAGLRAEVYLSRLARD